MIGLSKISSIHTLFSMPRAVSSFASPAAGYVGGKIVGEDMAQRVARNFSGETEGDGGPAQAKAARLAKYLPLLVGGGLLAGYNRKGDMNRFFTRDIRGLGNWGKRIQREKLIRPFLPVGTGLLSGALGGGVIGAYSGMTNKRKNMEKQSEAYDQEDNRIPFTGAGLGAISGLALARKRMQNIAEQEVVRQSKSPFNWGIPWVSKAKRARIASSIGNVKSPLSMMGHPTFGPGARKAALLYTLGFGGLGLWGGSKLKKRLDLQDSGMLDSQQVNF
jgi:hypothetical protein